MNSTHVRLSRQAHESISALSNTTNRHMSDLVSLACKRLVEDARKGLVSLGTTSTKPARRKAGGSR